MSSSELFSHPQKPLRIHLENVKEFSLKSLNSRKPDFSSIGIDDKSLSVIVKSIALSHDFGKSTKYFQDYLKESIDSGIKRTGPLTNHGLISAVFCWYITGKEVEKSVADKGLFSLIRYISYEVVRRHHGDIGNISNEIRDLNDDNKYLTKEQLKSIDRGSLYSLYDVEFNKTDIDCFFENYDAILSDFSKGKRVRESRKYLLEEKRLEYTLLEQYLYSLLISSDKSDASGVYPELSCAELDSSMAESYIEGRFPEKGINLVRMKIFRDINSKAEKLDLSDRIYSINVPTGGGKTLAAIGFALKLRNRVHDKINLYPRIIYSLPFTSIIDQNFAVFEDVYENFYGKKPATDVLLKHHHLSEIYYRSEKGEEYSTRESRYLIEGWNSEIIVTTFVQLFHSLFSNRNHTLIKYHNIVNSIVLLDEVQSLPPKYWPVFRKYLDVFSRLFNTYFVFITATQPLIFKPEKEITELCTGRDEYFRSFDRVRMRYFKDPVKMCDFESVCLKDIFENQRSDFLFIMNTKKSALDLYEYIKSNLAGEDLSECIFLSTYVVPHDRLEKIKKIRCLKGKKRLIVVSTQLVEAGVDIDMDVVYRDFGPLDSINQAAGRCNRNSRLKYGIVNIYSVLNENGKRFSDLVYDITLLDKTRRVLENCTEIEESRFLDMNKLYFSLLSEAVSNDESDEILDYLYVLSLESAEKKFKLIKDEYPQVDVFVEADLNASAIWKEYQEIKSVKDSLERRDRFYSIKGSFLDYVISVPKTHKGYVGYDEDLNIGHVSLEEVEQGNLYDADTGYKTPDKESLGEGAIVF
ncbi:CRISPR-associated endonuclease/helicase Cas3 [Methanomicrobium sp. W14]|uniref:CRISPR-associated helicase Cas3' n=1 Tax=Methanomicrobium sp. W14 TaxID=2817839 RepID=UPI001AE584AD|nr:CRISPR-associated helicase Cas3' [Methanomicrobium sp. W14]MBP2133629.1 CRISPR-associated endonuclease/helicase Cas3 [Methanomicrobium sp. W14]